MRCRWIERGGAGALEAAPGDLGASEHLLSCPRCRRIARDHRETAARIAELPAGPGPLPAWQSRVRIRILRERGAAKGARRARRRGPARAWILAYAAVIALFTVAELAGYASARTFERQALAEREDLARQLDSAVADIELVEVQLSISLQITHIAHAWASGREDLAQARLLALDELGLQHAEALAEQRRVRGR